MSRARVSTTAAMRKKIQELQEDNYKCGHTIAQLEQTTIPAMQAAAEELVAYVEKNLGLEDFKTNFPTAARDLAIEPWALTVKFDALPKLSQNGPQSNRYAVAKERKHWRNLMLYAVGNKAPLKPLDKIEALFIRYSARECDDDNLAASFKSLRDGIADAGVIPDDSKKHLIATYEWRKIGQNKGYVEIIMREII